MHSSKNPKAATLPHSFTKSNVRKIGEILRTQDQPSPAYTQAITDLDVWRAAHMHPMRICYEQAIRDANRISQEIIVTQRLKRLESILGKLTRFPAMNLAKMRDVGGVRIICPDIKTLVRFQKYYLRHDKKQDVIDYILNPRPSGYRGIHLVRSFRLTSSNQQIDALAVEIQLRTFLQHLWATAVETVDAFRGTTMKFGNSDRGWEEFFALVANAFAIIENQPKISQYAKYSLANTLSTINQVDQQRHILSYIEVCAKTNYIKTPIRNNHAEYVLLAQYGNSVKLNYFSDEACATKAYLSEEKSDDSTNRVLVSVNRLRELKEAYPNYFLDLRIFNQFLRQLIAIYQHK